MMKILIEKLKENNIEYKLFNDRILNINANCFDIMEMMEDMSIDMICTDPPYNILKHKIETGIDIEKFLIECKRLLKDNSFLCYTGQQPTITDWNYICNKMFNYKNEVIWYKRQGTAFMLDMLRMFENIMFYTKGKKKFNDIKLDYVDVEKSLADFKNSETVLRCIGYFKTFLGNYRRFKEWEDFKFKGIMKNTKLSTANDELYKNNFGTDRSIAGLNSIIEGKKIQNLVSFQQENKITRDMSRQGGGDNNHKHPTVKPILLYEYLLKISTQENELILDQFGGSGTTAIACLNLNRKCISIELDKDYYNISNNRLQKKCDELEYNLIK